MPVSTLPTQSAHSCPSCGQGLPAGAHHMDVSGEKAHQQQIAKPKSGPVRRRARRQPVGQQQEGALPETTALVEAKAPAFIVDTLKKDVANYPQDVQVVMHKALSSNYLSKSNFDEQSYRDLAQLALDQRISGQSRAAAQWLLYKQIAHYPEACIQAERHLAVRGQQESRLPLSVIGGQADAELASDIANLLAFSLIPKVEAGWERDENVLNKELPSALESFFAVGHRKAWDEDLDRHFWLAPLMTGPWFETGFKTILESAKQRVSQMTPQQQAQFLFDSIRPVGHLRPGARQLAVEIETPKDVMNFSATASFKLGF